MKKRSHDEISFWQSTTDILSALLLVTMLVMLLLVLYLMHVPQEEWDSYGAYTPTPRPTVTPHFGDGDFDEDDEEGDETDWNNDGGGGGGGLYTYTPVPSVTPSATVTPTPTPTPYNPSGGGGGHGGNDPYGEFGKAAVYAMIVDSETGRVIPRPGIIFELFGDNHVRQTLNTYYPERVWYQDFETTELGTFYLPEKIPLESYYFRAQNAPEGYDDAENAFFHLDEPYDWPEPYVVRIPFDPSKNIIHVKMTDANTGLPVSGGTFRIIAAQDIITPDGTMRYARGEAADVVRCGEDGQGESIELYLGDYTVVQEGIPEYYAGLDESDTVTVRKKDVFDTAVYLDYTCGKTQIIVTATDAAYGHQTLAGLDFEVYRAGDEQNTRIYTTDEQGRFVLTNLDKDSTYCIRQIAALPDYRFEAEPYTVAVSGRGLIEESPVYHLDVVNRIVRVSVSVKDTLLGSIRSDVSMGLYDENGNAVRLWTSSAMPEVFEGLVPGRYALIVDGNTQQQKTIFVEDTGDVQTFEYKMWTVADTALAAGCVAIVCAAFAFLLLRRKRK